MTLPEQDFLVARPRIPQWRLSAACLDEDVESFFPKGRPRADRKTICAACPVQADCLEFALESPYEPYGIYAGLDPSDLIAAWKRRHPKGA